jgi:hypothetical protein
MDGHMSVKFIPIYFQLQCHYLQPCLYKLYHVEFHFQNKFEKLVHLAGFIIRKFVTMHGHMNVKFIPIYFQLQCH